MMHVCISDRSVGAEERKEQNKRRRMERERRDSIVSDCLQRVSVFRHFVRK